MNGKIDEIYQENVYISVQTQRNIMNGAVYEKLQKKMYTYYYMISNGGHNNTTLGYKKQSDTIEAS